MVVGYLAIVPLGYLLWGTFFDAGGPTLRHFREAYASQGLGAMAANSLLFAAGSTVVAVGIGTVLAYLIARTDVPLKGLMFVAALVPLVIPGILHTIAWIFLASPRVGLINRALEPLLGPGAFDVFSMGGMIVVEGLHLSPLVFLLLYAAFRSMDPALEESGLLGGARLRTVVRRVTLPLAAPALAAAVLVAVVRGLEAFEVPALLGIPGGVWVFTSRIWRALATYPRRFGEAGAYAFSLLVLTAAGVLLYARLASRARRFQTITGRGFRPRPMPLGRWRGPATAVLLAYVVVAVVLPLGVLLYASTQRFYTVPSFSAIAAGTLDNYRTLLGSGEVLRAFRNSVALGIGSATVVTLLLAIVAWVVVRSRARARWALDAVAFLPLAVPGLVLGVGLLFVYLRAPVPVYGTLWILFIAYVTRYMPYGMRYASAAMHQVGAELEEAAVVAGARWWATFRRVVLPLLAPGLVAGWIYVLLVSFRELSGSILLYSPGNEVLSVVMWEQWQNVQATQLAALGVLMVAALALLAAAARRLGARIGIREPVAVAEAEEVLIGAER